MNVVHLQLSNFRSYGQLELALEPGVTTLVGANGQGKTNIVEAVRYLSTLQSHRVASDAPLIRQGQQSAVVAAKVHKGGRTLVLEVTIHAGRANEARLGRTPTRPREIAGLLRTVVFSPEDLALVKGDPGVRRDFMDQMVVALHPTMAGTFADFDRVLRQRSSMLKTAKLARGDLTTLDIWDEKFAELGTKVMASRASVVDQLQPFVAQAYRDLAGEDHDCGLVYRPSVDQGTTLADAVATHRDKEIERGVCLVGPHRDDLEVSVGPFPVKGYASHGESWSAALALRWATYGLLTSDDGPHHEDDGEPVVILDDVFAELDTQRRTALADLTAQASQVLITAAVPEDVPATLSGQIVDVADGQARPRQGTGHG